MTHAAALCITCRSPKTHHECGLCAEPLCRDCALFLDAGTFAFRSTLAAELKHSHYCQVCHQGTVEPALEGYAEALARAREVFVYFKDRNMRFVPLLKRSKTDVRVASCGDRDETILRLAFEAAEQGFNAIIETEVSSEKVRNEGWQTTLWRGRAVPAQVDEERIARSEGRGPKR